MKYPALTFVSTIQIIFGWVAVVGGAFVAVWGMSEAAGASQNAYVQFEGMGRVVAGLGIAGFGFFSVLVGEWSKVFTDIEANSARSAEIDQRILGLLERTAFTVAAPPTSDDAIGERVAPNARAVAPIPEPVTPSPPVVETVEPAAAPSTNEDETLRRGDAPTAASAGGEKTRQRPRSYCPHLWRSVVLEGRVVGDRCSLCGVLRT